MKFKGFDISDGTVLEEYNPDMIFDNLNEVLTAKEAANLLKCSLKSIYRFSREGKIPHKKIGCEYRYLHVDLIQWLKGN